MRFANCHPDRKHHVKGYCKQCHERNYAKTNERRREKRKEYRIRAELRGYSYEYRNRSEVKAAKKAYYNSDEYRIGRRQKRNEYNKRPETREMERRRKYNNIKIRLADNLRSRLKGAFKNNCKTGSAVRDLGCSIEELRIYLESKFQPGMSWDNYGFRGWHIDHIIPLAKFDLTDREELLKACHYTNLQPLWAEDNMRKNKY
jgi:hypothetical protein